MARRSSPVLLIAPHGGRRDPARRPWTAGNLRVNDLHTASLAADLTAATEASAVVNDRQDRNEVDLNRISAAHDGAPWFLERVAAALDAALADHRRVTVVVVHGWNVIQPAVDIGLGCARGPDPFVVGPGAAVSPAFAASAVRRLVAACGARGIDATVGARYPARHRENLLQLFTRRYRDDPRPLVRAIAARAARVEAVQLELGIPLRWPGPWRDRLVAACTEWLRALDAPAPQESPDSRPSAGSSPVVRRLEFTAPVLSGLVNVDGSGGGRLLLFPPAGGLALFTGERTGTQEPGAVAGLAVRPSGDGGLGVRFHGPLLHFPDTTPFLDLETGLASARLVEADVTLDFAPEEPHGTAGPAGGEFGAVSGSVLLDGAHHPIAGHGFAEDGWRPGPWPRLRAALRLGERERLAVTLALDGGPAEGFLCRPGGRERVTAARATLGAAESPLARVALDVELANGEHVRVVARALHRLPVIRGRGSSPVRIEFAACRLESEPGDHAGPAGWCEVAGL